MFLYFIIISSIATKYRKSPKSKAKYILFNTKIGLIKLVNTINKFFGIERLPSRDCEQYFGQFRNHFYGNETA